MATFKESIMAEDVLDSLQQLVQAWEDGRWEWNPARFKLGQEYMEELMMLLEHRGRGIKRQIGIER